MWLLGMSIHLAAELRDSSARMTMEESLEFATSRRGMILIRRVFGSASLPLCLCPARSNTLSRMLPNTRSTCADRMGCILARSTTYPRIRHSSEAYHDKPGPS